MKALIITLAAAHGPQAPYKKSLDKVPFEHHKRSKRELFDKVMVGSPRVQASVPCA